MSEMWPSALDARIAAGKAEPISEGEKEAALQFNETYDGLFGSSKLGYTYEPEPTHGYLNKLAKALGL